MSENKLPVFRGTKPSVENYCAQCGTTQTAGCWRRGWAVDNDSVNLCNKCGLQYKNGKLEATNLSLNLDPRSGESSPQDSPESSLREDRAETEPYVSYSMERQADVGLAKRVLFFVHDVEGNTKLAVTGFDARGTGHFTYESVEGFAPSLKCRNRAAVLAWLKDLGASRIVEGRSAHGNTTRTMCHPERVRPILDKNYCSYRIEDNDTDGDVSKVNFYLVDSEGNERIAIRGSKDGDSYQYRSCINDQDIVFEDREEAIGWLDWIIGKVGIPPFRFQTKEQRKLIRTRVRLSHLEKRLFCHQQETYTSSLTESGSTKRRISGLVLEDMKIVFGDEELMKWVLRKPTTEEINQFHEWRHKLTVESTGHEIQNNSTQDPTELLNVLHRIQKSDTCLKLLELSSLGRPVSALRRSPNREVSELASEIATKWNNWTTRALEKASEARKKNFIIS